MDAADSTQRAAVESLAAQLAVNEIDQSGKVVLEPELSVQDMMTRQIGQLWEQHANFEGISDTDSDTMSTAGDEDKVVATDNDGEPTMDAYAVRASVHESLRVAQSEIQVSLDMVRLLLAAKKRAAREAAVQLQEGAQLSRHGQEQRQKELGFAARVGDVEVTVGGTPFPVDILGAMRVDAAHATNQVQQQQRREDELRFVLGAKHKQLTEAADTLERSAQRLKKMVRGEARFWRTAFELRRRNWVVLHQSQVPGMQRAFGDRYFVRFGYADAGSPFADDAVAELLRSDDDPEDDAMDVDGAEPTPVFIPKTDDRAIAVSLAVAAQGRQSSVLGFSTAGATPVEGHTAYDRLHQRLLRARCGLFDRELFHRLCREARVLELGSVRTVGPNTDVLMVALSRDNVGVRFEWSLQEPNSALDTRFDEKSQFAQWQGEFYAGMARVMVGMSQRRAHAAAKSFQLGDGLLSRALLATSGVARRVAPEAFASVTDDSASGEATAVVARADLLVLSPALQGAQFAKWQHVLSASVQRACAAWRRLVDEPIEVISHLARTHRIPAANQSRVHGTQADNLVYMVRMRFQGGTVMEFWLATIGRMYFVKGYYPPMAKFAQQSDVRARPEQSLIRRVFRVVPMSSLGEFRDQLRRELQSLVLLRVAAALTRDQALARRGWRMGQCHVHQSQMCVVGELWQNARQRQIIGVAKWDASSPSTCALAGIGDSEEWNLTLYFGPKHPTTFDIPRNMSGPWVTCYPPTQPLVPRKQFEEQLLDTLLSAL
ncbi:hypothetical protein IW147_004026 [Coemansia sp. RSA 720]|nr:hypothetical protein IW147_004026 [Coemansia sp. RSA 720]